jgi:hypothetical protein
MQYKRIMTKQDADFFVNNFFWNDAFLREMYVLTPSFFSKDKFQINPNIYPNIGMIFLTSDNTFSGIEIVLNQVKNIYINFEYIFKPKIIVEHEIKFSLNDGLEYIYAKEMLFRQMDQEEIIGDRIKSSDYWCLLISESKM